MYHTNSSLAITMLLISFVQLIPPYVVKHWLEKNYINTRNIEGELTEHLICGYNGLSTIKSFNGEKWYMSNLKKIHERYYAIGKKSEITAQVEDALNKTVVTILTYITYGIIGLFVLSNSISLEESVALAVLSKKFYDGANMIFSAIAKYFIFKKAKDRLRILTFNCPYGPKEEPSKDDLLFKLKNLNYGFESNLLFKDFNLNLEKGVKYAIVGSNGSGKSTLLNIIGLMDSPSRGTISINEEEILGGSADKMAEIRNRVVSFIFQDYNLIEEYTVYENVEMPLRYRGVRLRDRKEPVKQALAKVKLEDKIKSKVNKLSGGQRQRVAIARALVANGDIILADEPTGALDQGTGKDIMEILVNLNKEGKTIIMVTHDPNIASQCKRHFSIVDGVLKEESLVNLSS